jgi:hypothetical protein
VRIGDDGRVAAGPFRGPIELWGKWSSEGLLLPPRQLIAVEKTRWLRRWGTSGREIAVDKHERPMVRSACNVDLTRIELSRGRVWWTLGFQEFGVDTLSGRLRPVAAELGRRKPPASPEARMSYPTWLAHLGPSGGKT